ncbi:MAG TPA: cytidine deaminase [Flavobacteriaceae bacterium]|nr:cytidine deaminase [Flavobacteriaceae bacterium]MCB9212853.1 cytidine deaminase [Alteromonas sp.]HPF11475.1 cytidine deaminase [Flavobacteriaceae bacterium]HQU20638.1 cytidine deaminase [Flavobacteriaceae bacterium]HQU65039.1 cytidine deaminase [Flavobacteriaceae bacterium]
MKKITFETHLEVYESIKNLPESIQNLMDKAQEARNKAYAPYSRFKVGAALLLANGTVVLGNNQENAAFPSGLCAERVAAYHAGANFPNEPFVAIAIAAGSQRKTNEVPVPPCGACRQALAEYEITQKKDIALYFMGETGKVVKAHSIKSLLPLSFDGSYL